MVPDANVSAFELAALTMLTRGVVGPNFVIKDGAAPLKVNAGLTAEEPVR